MGKHLGAENGDSVLGTERNQTTGTPRDIVHYSVAPCSYEYLLHLHLINHGSQVTNTVWCVCVCVNLTEVEFGCGSVQATGDERLRGREAWTRENWKVGRGRSPTMKWAFLSPRGQGRSVRFWNIMHLLVLDL